VDLGSQTKYWELESPDIDYLRKCTICIYSHGTSHMVAITISSSFTIWTFAAGMFEGQGADSIPLFESFDGGANFDYGPAWFMTSCDRQWRVKVSIFDHEICQASIVLPRNPYQYDRNPRRRSSQAVGSHLAWESRYLGFGMVPCILELGRPALLTYWIAINKERGGVFLDQEWKDMKSGGKVGVIYRWANFYPDTPPGWESIRGDHLQYQNSSSRGTSLRYGPFPSRPLNAKRHPIQAIGSRL